MGSEQFYTAFCKVLRENPKLKDLPWSGEGVNRRWTDLILGEKGKEKDGVLYNMTADENFDKDLLFAKEWMHIDGIFYKASEALLEPTEGYRGGYQYLYRVIVEVENNYRTFIHEICKLTHFNCPLKVGITYVETANKVALSNLKEKIGHILQENHKLREEFPDTKYLFIIVREPEKAEPIKIIYDSKGVDVTDSE